MARLIAVQGDITTADTEAVVNAANERMLGGGGVDGAIHRAAGPELLAACRRVPEVAPGVRCPTGTARITPGYRLDAAWVIHAVGPIFRDRPEDRNLLATAHRASLQLAVDHGIPRIAFPAISCGVYGFPATEAASIAVGIARERAWPLEEIRFVLFSPKLLALWVEAIERSVAPT